MFSPQEKHAIADAVYRILRDTEHPELPKHGQPIRFQLRVDGAEPWSWAEIQNNEAVSTTQSRIDNEIVDFLVAFHGYPDRATALRDHADSIFGDAALIESWRSLRPHPDGVKE